MPLDQLRVLQTRSYTLDGGHVDGAIIQDGLRGVLSEQSIATLLIHEGWHLMGGFTNHTETDGNYWTYPWNQAVNCIIDVGDET